MIRHLKRASVGVGLLAVSLLAGAEGEHVEVLTNGDLTDWKSKAFVGETEYESVTEDGVRTVCATSNESASGRYREIKINLEKTPIMRWRWRVDNTLGDIDESTKPHDDYPARVYVLSVDRLFFWKTIGLSYVWASGKPKDTSWPSAYSDNVRMIAMRSGEAETHRWVMEKRNVVEDFKKFFGRDVKTVHSVAIMTDTDDTETSTKTCYGDIYFSEY